MTNQEKLSALHMMQEALLKQFQDTGWAARGDKINVVAAFAQTVEAEVKLLQQYPSLTPITPSPRREDASSGPRQAWPWPSNGPG